MMWFILSFLFFSAIVAGEIQDRREVLKIKEEVHLVFMDQEANLFTRITIRKNIDVFAKHMKDTYGYEYLGEL